MDRHPSSSFDRRKSSRTSSVFSGGSSNPEQAQADLNVALHSLNDLTTILQEQFKPKLRDENAFIRLGEKSFHRLCRFSQTTKTTKLKELTLKPTNYLLSIEEYGTKETLTLCGKSLFTASFYECSILFSKFFPLNTFRNSFDSLDTLHQSSLQNNKSFRFQYQMQEILGMFFLDGLTLYEAQPFASNKMSINWINVRGARTMDQLIDYLVLQYADFKLTPSYPYGCLLWESVEFPNCPSLERSHNIRRKTLHQSGFLLKPKNATEMEIEFYWTQGLKHNPIDKSTKQFLIQQITNIFLNLNQLLIRQRIAAFPLLLNLNLEKNVDKQCQQCHSTFNVMSNRRHHCRLCGNATCKKCCQTEKIILSKRNITDNPTYKIGSKIDLRICNACREKPLQRDENRTSQLITSETLKKLEEVKEKIPTKVEELLLQRPPPIPLPTSRTSPAAFGSASAALGRTPPAVLGRTPPVAPVPSEEQQSLKKTKSCLSTSSDSTTSSPKQQKPKKHVRIFDTRDLNNLKEMEHKKSAKIYKFNSPIKKDANRMHSMTRKMEAIENSPTETGTTELSPIDAQSPILEETLGSLALEAEDDVIVAEEPPKPYTIEAMDMPTVECQPIQKVFISQVAEEEEAGSDASSDDEFQIHESPNSSNEQIIYDPMASPYDDMTTETAIVRNQQSIELDDEDLIMTNSPYTYDLTYLPHQTWPAIPYPKDELERLQKVESLLVKLKDMSSQWLDILCEKAEDLFQCSIVSVSLLDSTMATLLSKRGVSGDNIPRNIVFDAHTIMSKDPTIILNATQDPRVCYNPLVLSARIQFYIGIPLIDTEGYALGVLAIGDSSPREFISKDDIKMLEQLGKLIIERLEQQSSRNNKKLMTTQDESRRTMELAEAHRVMQRLLNTAYHTQCQVKMQVTEEE